MTRKTSKWKRVEQAIKELIVSGQWKLGEKLPTYDELEIQFQVSRITLQQVVAQLKRDGYITSRARQGLFVSLHPPHLTRIGIVIPRDEAQVRFWYEVVKTARIVAEHLGRELVIYRNMEVSEEAERQLMLDVENRLLSGILFLYSISAGERGYSIFRDPQVPKAVPASTFLRGKRPSGLTLCFQLDERRMVCRALDYLQKCGCSRIAYFGNIGGSAVGTTFVDEIGSRGLYSPEEWHFPVAMQNVEIAGKIAQLLMALPEQKRPDGIFIGDDNFTSIVVKGLASTKVRLPDELPVVAHYNWSVGSRDHFPVKCLGFDLKSMLQRIFEAFQTFYETGTLSQTLLEPPVFEEELNVNQINKEGFHEQAV